MLIEVHEQLNFSVTKDVKYIIKFRYWYGFLATNFNSFDLLLDI